MRINKLLLSIRSNSRYFKITAKAAGGKALKKCSMGSGGTSKVMGTMFMILIREEKKITLVNCGTHARRYFEKV